MLSKLLVLKERVELAVCEAAVEDMASVKLGSSEETSVASEVGITVDVSSVVRLSDSIVEVKLKVEVCSLPGAEFVGAMSELS